MNAQMFNSFLDGTKSSIEMAAVANAAGLHDPSGLAFPAVHIDDLPNILKPKADGGILSHRGQVEVISSLQHDGSRCRGTCAGVFMSLSQPAANTSGAVSASTA